MLIVEEKLIKQGTTDIMKKVIWDYWEQKLAFQQVK